MEKRLGKIKDVRFGLGSYQDAMIGLHVTLGGGSWGVMDSKCTWDPQMVECTKHTKWTEEERSKNLSDIMRHISKLLSEAKVNSIEKLKNVPVEVTFDGNMLVEWRILTEVL